MLLEGLEKRRLFAAAGELDPDFGDGGVVDLGPESGFGDIAVLGDDRVLVMQKGAIVRYTPSGDIDTTFGDDGSAPFSFDDDPATEEQGG